MVVTAPPPLHDSEQAAEGGVIDDARERQRRHRRIGAALIAAGLAVGALIVGLVGGGGGSDPSRLGRNDASSATPGTHAAGRSPAIRAPLPGVAGFGLLAPGVGWVVDPPRLYLTRDGWRSWGGAALDSSHAQGFTGWSSSSSPSQLAVSVANDFLTIPAWASAKSWDARVRGAIVMTANAGRTWSSDAFVPHVAPGALSFLNRRRGFVLGYRPAAHHDPWPGLYETRDGARTWTRIASSVPVRGGLSFANARYGLAGGFALDSGLADGVIYRTSDGGGSWTKTSLCGLANGFNCEVPHLFPSGRGVVLATRDGEQAGRTRVVIYTTRNYGVSWSRHILPDTPRLTDNVFYIPFAAPTPDDLFAWVSPYLYASHDGGMTWSRYAEPELDPTGVEAGFGPPWSDIAFANRDYGWYADGPLFEYTTDGGRRWTKFRQSRQP